MDETNDALKGAIRRFAPPSGGGSAPDEVRALATRLDDRGCAYGRVNNARIDDLAKGYERVETKLNAVLLAVTGTFVTTLVGMVVYHLRGG